MSRMKEGSMGWWVCRMYWFPLFLVLIEVEKCVCIWLSVWGHLKRIHEGTLLCGRKIYVNIPTLCVCV